MRRIHKKRNRLYTRIGNLKKNPDPQRLTNVQPFILNEAYYLDLKKFLAELYMLEVSHWPEKNSWPRCNGVPSFSIEVRKISSWKNFITVRFSRPVKLPDGKVGSIFRIGGMSSIIETF